jgi:hypothetical protein
VLEGFTGIFDLLSANAINVGLRSSSGENRFMTDNLLSASVKDDRGFVMEKKHVYFIDI